MYHRTFIQKAECALGQPEGCEAPVSYFFWVNMNMLSSSNLEPIATMQVCIITYHSSYLAKLSARFQMRPPRIFQKSSIKESEAVKATVTH